MAGFNPNTKPSKSVASDDLNSERTSRQTSPKPSPMRQRTANMDAVLAGSRAPQVVLTEHSVPSPIPIEDNFTMVIPKTFKLPAVPMRARSDNERTALNGLAMPSMAEEDNFTLVIPRKSSATSTAPPGQTQGNVIVTLPTREQPSPPVLEEPTAVEPDTKQSNIRKPPAPSPVIQRNEGVHMDDLIVFEDPTAEDIVIPIIQNTQKAVLEELPINEQNQHIETADGSKELTKPAATRRAPSPTKRAPVEQIATLGTDASKVQRLLTNGVEKIHEGTLDLHGLRKLQEIIRQTDEDSAPQLTQVMQALIGSLEKRRESGDGHVSKASTIQSQTLSTIRLIAMSKAGASVLKETLSRALCAMITVRAQSDGSSMAMELDRTVEEMVKRSNNSVKCIDAVTEFSELDSTILHDSTTGHSRATTLALRVLSRLVSSAGMNVTPAQQARLGKLAVRCLNDLDAEVRRADTNFCVELRQTFDISDEEGFWKTLEGARETQMNLIAYYIAKRRKSVA